VEQAVAKAKKYSAGPAEGRQTADYAHYQGAQQGKDPVSTQCVSQKPQGHLHGKRAEVVKQKGGWTASAGGKHSIGTAQVHGEMGESIT
jgi:hypothetical protein